MPFRSSSQIRLEELIAFLEARCEYVRETLFSNNDASENPFLMNLPTTLSEPDSKKARSFAQTAEAHDTRSAIASTLQQVLDAVRQEMVRLDITQADREHHNRSKPAASLPPEILGYIFELACMTHDASNEDYYLFGPLVRETRDSILMTCRVWHKVAMDTSALWTNLVYVFDFDNHEGPPIPKPHLPRIAPELQYSQGRPWQIFLQGRADDKRLNDVLKIIGDDKRNFELLYMCTLPTRGFGSGLELFQERHVMPHLHTILLDWSNEQETAEVFFIPIAPLLRHLQLEYRTEQESAHLRLIPPGIWKVTTISLMGDINPASVVAALESCEGLETLEWAYEDSDEEAVRWHALSPLPLRRLNHLRRLTVCGNLPVYLMGTVETPSLTELRIQPPSELPFSIIPPSVHFGVYPLSNAQLYPSLQSLLVPFRQFLINDPRAVDRFLLAHPLLEELFLPFDLDPELLDCLCAIAHGSLRLSKLRRVWVRANTEMGLLLAWDLLDRHAQSGEPCRFTVILDTAHPTASFSAFDGHDGGQIIVEFRQWYARETGDHFRYAYGET